MSVSHTIDRPLPKLTPADLAEVERAYGGIEEAVRRLRQQPDTEAARKAVLAVRNACLKAAQALAVGEDNARDLRRQG